MTASKEIYKEWKIECATKPMVTIQHPNILRQELNFIIEKIIGTSFTLSTNQNCNFFSSKDQYMGFFDFPTVGCIEQSLQVIQVKSGHQSRILISIDLATASSPFKEKFGMYLFKYARGVNLEVLRNIGIKLKSIRQLIDYGYAETQEEIQQVIVLRKIAYSDTEKVGGEATFYNAYDEKSKIPILKHQGKVIASARLFFPKSNEEELEHQQYGINFYKDFPNNENICEIMRVCTHPAYRKSDLLLGFFEFVGATVIEQKRKFILGCASEKLLPLYKKIGFMDIKLTYKNPDLNNILHHLILADISHLKAGRGMNPIAWNIIWGDLFLFSKNQRWVDYNVFDTFRFKLLNVLRPLAFRLQKRRSKR